MFNLEFLQVIREAELERVTRLLPAPPAQILEIGAGTGQQALLLTDLGYDVVAVDIEASNYRDSQVLPIQDFDGRVLPFADSSFDVVYSSNVLEHVDDLPHLLRETRRVLRTNGVGIHLMPTPAWRFWTTVTAIPTAPQRALAALRERGALRRRAARAVLLLGTAVVQRRHGERGNAVTEHWHFRAARWRRELVESDLAVVSESPTGLFYTGNMLLGGRLSLRRRAALAGMLGSACRTFVVARR